MIMMFIIMLSSNNESKVLPLGAGPPAPGHRGVRPGLCVIYKYRYRYRYRYIYI